MLSGVGCGEADLELSFPKGGGSPKVLNRDLTRLA